MDNGGPSREFWRLFVKGAIDHYCIGSPGNCVFMRNTPALQVNVVHMDLANDESS